MWHSATLPKNLYDRPFWVPPQSPWPSAPPAPASQLSSTLTIDVQCSLFNGYQNSIFSVYQCLIFNIQCSSMFTCWLVHTCTIFLCCLDLDDPYRDTNMTNKDQLTTCWPTFTNPLFLADHWDETGRWRKEMRRKNSKGNIRSLEPAALVGRPVSEAIRVF